jgi:hypothetical protein
VVGLNRGKDVQGRVVDGVGGAGLGVRVNTRMQQAVGPFSLLFQRNVMTKKCAVKLFFFFALDSRMQRDWQHKRG